jgi:molecular chaperone DnaJ
MDDPWKVLGVRQGASQEEIKSAYRKLVKQYHPDRYADNPLKELAQEKLKQINEAYDMLTRNGGAQQSAAGTGHASGEYTGTAGGDFLRVRQLIQSGNIVMAEALLDNMTARPAEWHFLKGMCLLRRGMYIQGRQHIEMAVEMDPGNPEYRSALANIAFGGGVYRQRTYRAGGAQDDFCRICECLICSDCCCECMGGDLIPCC